MNKEQLEYKIEKFMEGNLKFSIHESYEREFERILIQLKIENWYKEKHGCYTHYKTRSVPWVQLRNSEIKIMRKMKKDSEIKKIKAEIEILKQKLFELE